MSSISSTATPPMNSPHVAISIPAAGQPTSTSDPDQELAVVLAAWVRDTAGSAYLYILSLHHRAGPPRPLIRACAALLFLNYCFALAIWIFAKHHPTGTAGLRSSKYLKLASYFALAVLLVMGVLLVGLV